MVPARAVALPGGLRCTPQAVDLDAWQAHLLKHPLGVDALRNGGAWNNEGWDATTPPVVTADERTQLIAGIHSAEALGGKCGVRELRGARTPSAPKEPCYSCVAPLLPRCATVLNAPEALGQRYAAVIDALLAEVAEDRAIQVQRTELSRRLTSRVQHPAWIEAGVVLAIGVLPVGPRRESVAIVRIARGDGTRTDFKLNRVDLTWRTTYRLPQASVNTRSSFLMQMPAKTPSLPLSDVYVVPRGWWEAHGL